MKSRRVAEIKSDPTGVRDSCLSEMKARQRSKIAEIRQALVAAGFDTVSSQAAVLGLSRSTAWSVLDGSHKGSGLSSSVINRILRSQQLPTAARKAIEEYVRDKLLGAYGHNQAQLRTFRTQLGYPTPLHEPRRR